MNTEEAIQKIASILDENRELKETIQELNTDIHIKDRGISQRISMIDEIKQDRDWWRTSALDTEKARAHLAVELIECRNTVDEQNKEISKLKGGAWMLHNEDDRIDALQYGSITGLFNHVKELEAKLVDVNRRFDHVVRFNEKLVHDTNELFAERDATIDAQNARIKELQKERDEYKESIKLERIEHNTERKATTQFQNDKIKELKYKLIGRERQFNELDGVLDRTRELLHAAMDRIQTQNDEIAKKDDWISSYSKNDKRLNRLLDELRIDVRKRDKIIDELLRRRAR